MACMARRSQLGHRIGSNQHRVKVRSNVHLDQQQASIRSLCTFALLLPAQPVVSPSSQRPNWPRMLIATSSFMGSGGCRGRRAIRRGRPKEQPAWGCMVVASVSRSCTRRGFFRAEGIPAHR